MTNHIIDNSLRNLGKTVLWQYDRAVRLLSILKHMQVMFHVAVEQFWDFWVDKVLGLEGSGEFGCIVWGLLLGVPRPVVEGANGQKHFIATSVYRRVLLGSFYLQKCNANCDDIHYYLETVFGIDGKGALTDWVIEVSEYGWTAKVDEWSRTHCQRYRELEPFSKGTIFFYETNSTYWLCLDDIAITDNMNFAFLKQSGKIRSATNAELRQMETVIFRLYDTNGVCRKTMGVTANTLRISMEYEQENTRVTATAERRRKCGVQVVDYGDMSISFVKSEFFNEMHADQKAIFEQLGDAFLPYPLGIRTNEPVSNWVFGLADNLSPNGVEYYQAGRSYSKFNGKYSANNSFVVVPADEYQKLMREGAYCLVRFTSDIQPDVVGNPYLDSVILARYTSYEEAIQHGEPFDWDKIYRAGQQAVISFQDIADWYSVMGHKSEKLHLYKLKDNVAGVDNVMFYKLVFDVEKADVYQGDQTNVRYQSGIAYSEGDIFGYVDSDGNAFNWKCIETISAIENTSFEAIEHKCTKTSDGGPFIDTLSESHPPYVLPHSWLGDTSVFSIVPQNQVATIIPKDRLFVGLHNGMFKIFKNDTPGSLVICHSRLSDFVISEQDMNSVSTWYDRIGVPDPTPENLDRAAATIAIRNGCSTVYYSTAISFMPGVLYIPNDTVLFDGEERVFTQRGTWESKQDALRYTSRQAKAVLHAYYPLEFQ